jgi:hypothetical protein
MRDSEEDLFLVSIHARRKKKDETESSAISFVEMRREIKEKLFPRVHTQDIEMSRIDV